MVTPAVILCALVILPAAPARPVGPTPGVPAPHAALHAEDRPPRPLAPDPSPYTLRPGRFALQAEAALATRRADSARTTTLAWPLALRIGISDDTEILLALEALVLERASAAPALHAATHAGCGDLTLGVKVNLWGNDRQRDGGRSAFALAPFLTLPTGGFDAGDKAPGAGAALPLEMDLAEGLTFEIIPDLLLFRDPGAPRAALSAGTAAVLSAQVAPRLAIKGEFAGAIDTAPGPSWSGHLTAGLTIEISDDLLIEPALGVGLGPLADDLTAAITIVRRF